MCVCGSYYCVGEVVGEDVDVSVWEFAMMGGDDGDAEVSRQAMGRTGRQTASADRQEEEAGESWLQGGGCVRGHLWRLRGIDGAR